MYARVDYGVYRCLIVAWDDYEYTRLYQNSLCDSKRFYDPMLLQQLHGSYNVFS